MTPDPLDPGIPGIPRIPGIPESGTRGVKNLHLLGSFWRSGGNKWALGGPWGRPGRPGRPLDRKGSKSVVRGVPSQGYPGVPASPFFQILFPRAVCRWSKWLSKCIPSVVPNSFRKYLEIGPPRTSKSLIPCKRGINFHEIHRSRKHLHFDLISEVFRTTLDTIFGPF